MHKLVPENTEQTVVQELLVCSGTRIWCASLVSTTVLGVESYIYFLSDSGL